MEEKKSKEEPEQPKEGVIEIVWAEFEGMPVYSNVAFVSRLGTDVQIDFGFVDINKLAALVQSQAIGRGKAIEIQPKMVQRVIMPGSAFMQFKEQHIDRIYDALKKEFAK